MPQRSAWGGAGATLGADGWELRARVFGTPRIRSSLAGAQVLTQLVAGGLSLCIDRDAGPVELAGCVGPRAGRLFAEGRGYAVSQSTRLWWARWDTGLSARWPRESAVSLRLGVSGQVSLLRPVLRVRASSGEVSHRQSLPRVGLTSALSVIVALR